MRHSLMFLSAGIALAACSSGGGAGPTGTTSLQLSAARSDLVPGESVQLTWTSSSASGAAATSPSVSFTSSNSAVVTVSGAGVATAVGAGTANITGNAGSASGQLKITVQEGGLITAAGATIRAYGGAVELTVPAGAVGGETAVRVLTAANPLLDPTVVVGSIYSIEPTSLRFSSPAMLRVRFNATAGPVGLPASSIRLRQFEANAWTGLANGSANAGTTTATAPLFAGGLVSAGWVRPDSSCTSAESRQFDFWIGAWNVTQNGQAAGISDITVAPGGCAIFERFQSSGVGRSISFYEPSARQWYQTYVDDGGSRLLLAGEFANGNMDLFQQPVAGQIRIRTRWSAEGNNSRQQVAALSTNGGATFAPPQYDFLYVRR